MRKIVILFMLTVFSMPLAIGLFVMFLIGKNRFMKVYFELFKSAEAPPTNEALIKFGFKEDDNKWSLPLESGSVIYHPSGLFELYRFGIFFPLKAKTLKELEIFLLLA